MKLKVKEEHCKGCIWLQKEGLCPFYRCVRYFGWVTDKQSKNEILEGKCNDKTRN